MKGRGLRGWLGAVVLPAAIVAPAPGIVIAAPVIVFPSPVVVFPSPVVVFPSPVVVFPSVRDPELSDDSVQREWQIRDWAFEAAHGRAPQLLRDALEDADWVVRWSALEALLRGVSVGRDASLLREVALARLVDEHPNVRAAAVRLATAAGTPPPADRIAGLAADSVPAVRQATASWLGAHPSPPSRAALVALARDPDERVAGAARGALFSMSPAASRPVHDSAHDSAREPDSMEGSAPAPEFAREGSLELLAPLFFGAPSDELLATLEAACGEQDEPACRAWRATLAVIRARHGRPFRVDTLIDGWFGDASQLALRNQLLPWVSLETEEDWSEPLVAGIEALDGAHEGPRWERVRRDLERLGLEPEDAQRAWITALASGLGAEVTLRHVLDWNVSETTRRLALEEVASRFLEWDVELGRAWATQSVGIRLHLAELWGGVLMRTEDSVVGDLLADLLTDSDAAVRASAFRWLSRAARPAPYGEVLHRAWRDAPEADRLPWIALAPRAALPSFRDDLLEFGRVSGRARALAAEHLENYAGDEGVVEAVRSWLREELELFGRSRPDSDTARRHEGRVVSLVRALARLDLESSLRELEGALGASLRSSEEIGKAAAAALGRSSEGRELLAAYLDESVDLRTRIEAALQVAVGGGAVSEEAVVALRRDYGDSALDLRGRIIEACGRVGSAQAVTWLEELVEEGGRADPLAPPRALEALASCDPAAAFPILKHVAERGEAETRRSAIAALARLGGDPAASFLVALYRREFETLPDAADEQALFLREALLTALAQSDPIPAEIADEVLRGPLREAAAILERRFRSEHEPAPAFRWRGELALWAGLRAEMRQAVLEREPRWRGLDARLLLALADHTAGELRRDLLRAGLIGWSGEGDGHRSGLAATRLALLDECLEGGEWSAAATIARSLRTDLEQGVLTLATWEREVGRVSRLAGRDSLARVRSVELQARSWAAFEAGDLDAARRWAEAASRTVGWSERARDVQTRLEQRLEQP